jgi:hypothetical protein
LEFDGEWACMPSWFMGGDSKNPIGRSGNMLKTGFSSLNKSEWVRRDWVMAALMMGVYKFACLDLGDDWNKMKFTGALGHMIENLPLCKKSASTGHGPADAPERIRCTDNCMLKCDGTPGYYCTYTNVCGAFDSARGAARRPAKHACCRAVALTASGPAQNGRRR